MVTKHTPESLTAERADHNQDVWEIFGPEDSSLTGIPTKPLIARVTATYYGPGASEYYARRFAAAPAMLAALEGAISILREVGLDGSADEFSAVVRAAKEGA